MTVNLFMTTFRQFSYTCFLLPLECHEWSAAPISAYLRRGPRGCFGSECCTVVARSMAAPRVKLSLAPSH